MQTIGNLAKITYWAANQYETGAPVGEHPFLV
jgi:hypothetical protein